MDDEGDATTGADTDPSERQAALAAHAERVEGILHAATKRDADADVRDVMSADRDREADLKAFTSPDDGNGYGADLPARRHAAHDRSEAKGDRASAAEDRAALTEVGADPEAEQDRP